MKNSTRKTNQRRTSAARRHSGQPQHQQAETKGGGQQYGAGGEGKQYGEGSYSAASTRRVKSSNAVANARFHAAGCMSACSGGNPLGSPWRMSSLCANSWMTTL